MRSRFGGDLRLIALILGTLAGLTIGPVVVVMAVADLFHSVGAHP